MHIKAEPEKLQGCPFRHDMNIPAHAYCWLKEEAEKDACHSEAIPEWCPLKKGPVTVSIPESEEKAPRCARCGLTEGIFYPEPDGTVLCQPCSKKDETPLVFPAGFKGKSTQEVLAWILNWIHEHNQVSHIPGLNEMDVQRMIDEGPTCFG